MFRAVGNVLVCHNLAVSDALRRYYAVVGLRQGTRLDLPSPFVAKSVELFYYFQLRRLRECLKLHDGVIDRESATLIIFNRYHTRVCENYPLDWWTDRAELVFDVFCRSHEIHPIYLPEVFV